MQPCKKGNRVRIPTSEEIRPEFHGKTGTCTSDSDIDTGYTWVALDDLEGIPECLKGVDAVHLFYPNDLAPL